MDLKKLIEAVTSIDDPDMHFKLISVSDKTKTKWDH